MAKNNSNRIFKDCRTTTQHVTFITGMPGEEGERKKTVETIMTENVPKLMSETKPPIQKTHITLSRVSANKQTNKKNTQAYHHQIRVNQ